MKEQQRLWKNLLEILNPPTKICKICFKEIKCKKLSIIFSKNEILCPECSSLFKPIFKRFYVKGIPALAIYHYDETIRTYLYQFKGCFDYELYPVFLYRFIFYLRFLYKDYVIVPAPSYIEDDEIREFNHVEEIFSLLNLKIVKAFIKTEHHKQANTTPQERKEIVKYLKVKEDIDLTGQKILLVDDVYTTGSTMRSLIDLIRKKNPKTIRILVLSKTKG